MDRGAHQKPPRNIYYSRHFRILKDGRIARAVILQTFLAGLCYVFGNCLTEAYSSYLARGVVRGSFCFYGSTSVFL